MATTIPLYGFGGGGGTGATLTVTAPANATVTVSKGSKTKLKTASARGRAIFKGLESGRWRVAITDGSRYSSEDVTITSDYSATLAFYKRYGFRRAKNDSDPDGRIAYLFDAAGKTPMYVDLSTGSPVWGDWKDFVYEIACPVMLNSDGGEAYELNREDQTKKSDGSASDISDGSFAGNAMVRFSKFIWVKRYEDENYEYVIFSDAQVDEDYHAYAHTDAGGKVQPAFYWGMFKGSGVSGKLRSLADRAPLNNVTRSTEIAYAQANGAGHNTIYNSGWQFIGDLLTLISKSDNSREKFGTGRTKSSNSTTINTGTTKAYGPFWGSDNGSSDVKAFWIEGFWGNFWESMCGLINKNGKIMAKMTPPYSLTAEDYSDTGITPGGTSGGYLSRAKMDGHLGLVPMEANGSATTYYCDGLRFSNSNVSYAMVSGMRATDTQCGSRLLMLQYTADNKNTTFTARLTFLSGEV